MNWLQQRWENRAIYRYHFLQSTYISSIWAWFLTFWGKAAEPFLCVSVLYSGAKLLPGVSTPPMADTVMFIGQMLALDIGGLSLGKIAQQLEREGNREQAAFITKVSFFLIGLMIANVVLATVQHIFPTIDPIWITGIESGLLIVRSVMAVIYGYIIYNLHPSKQETAVVKSSDVNNRFEELLHMLTMLEKKLTEQSILLNQQSRDEFTKQVQAQGVNIQSSLKEELTTTVYEQHVTLRNQVASLLTEQMGDNETQIARALQEHAVTMSERVSQQLTTHLEKLTAQMGTLTRQSSEQLTDYESVNTKRPSNITVLTVNTFEKKQLVEHCLVTHPELKNADIQRMVKEQGVDVTPAYISMIRNGKRA